MRTIKLVVIGDSGVGKTSLRNQFVNGRFSTGYRATIGTDFITKTLPHYQNPEESVTLQIWDTAGQERFSSLSTAFFRGADAALLMFDVNRPETLDALTKWWETFKTYAPVSDEEAEDFCCIVVGNKIDLAEDGKASGEPNINGSARANRERRARVSEAEAERFLEELVPRRSIPDEEEDDECEDDIDDPFVVAGSPDHSRQSTGIFMRRAVSGYSLHSVASSHRNTKDGGEDINKSNHRPDSVSPPRPRSQSISIQPTGNGSADSFRQVLKSHPSDLLGGTMTTTHTSQTIYHTPSSSIFDRFESAPSSPFYSESNLPPTPLPGSVANGELLAPGANGIRVQRRMSNASVPSTSSSSAPTITPSLFLRTQASSTSAVHTPPTPIEESPSSSSFPFTSVNQASRKRYGRALSRGPPLPPRPERRPRLFLTSAKTGEGVSLVFEHITRRVCMSWSYTEALEARAAALGIGTESRTEDASRLRLPRRSSESGLVRLRERFKGGASNCCGS